MNYSRTQIKLLLVPALVVMAGCGLFRRDPPPGPEPLTKPVLELMPESADLVVAFPPANRIGEKSLAMIRGVVPEPARDWVDGFIAAIEGDPETDVDGSSDLAAALGSMGIAANAPIGFYLRTATVAVPGSTEIPADTLAVAFAFTASDPEKVRDWLETVERVIGGDESTEGELTALPAPGELAEAHGFGEKFGGYVMSGDRVVVGYDRAFVQEIANRIPNPMRVDYGTRECPAESDDAIAALVRADKAGVNIGTVLAMFAPVGGLTEFVSAHFPETTGVFSRDPILLTLDWSGESVEIAVRADLEEHESLRKSLGPPSRLRIAKAVPAATQALVSFRFNEESKALFLDLFAQTFVSGGDEEIVSDFAVADVFGPWVQFVDDELTLALTGKTETGPRGVGMLAVRNRGVMANLLLSLPVPGERVETFRKIDIKIMPNTELFYATARNTLVIGTDLPEVKESLEYLLDGTLSPAFENFEPRIDLAEPRYIAFAARSESVSDAIELAFDMPEWGTLLLDGAETVVDDIRVTGGIAGKWLDTRLSIHFHPPAPETPELVTE